VNEEVFAGLRFAAARAYQVLVYRLYSLSRQADGLSAPAATPAPTKTIGPTHTVRLVGAEVTDAGEELCE
jgi:hypothetical protein